MKTNELALQRLQKMELNDRINTVARDLETRRDVYRGLGAEILAKLLGITDTYQLGDGWSFWQERETMSISEYLRNYFPSSEVVYLIERKVPRERFEQLVALTEKWDDQSSPDISILTQQEQALLEQAISDQLTEGSYNNGLGGRATYTVTPMEGPTLEFVVFVEDDGTGGTLWSPYDLREAPSLLGASRHERYDR
ncbi:MAG: hypothetical protein H6978_00100 [Gammaproteobacteria bacterium]|nr:hypothetical protein [Gammaproteobacteria bacterium]